MARPTKEGIDYFPTDTHLSIPMKLIMAEFGVIGFGIVMLIYMQIYAEKGYYIDWNADVRLLFSKEHNVGDNLVSEIVNRCLERNIFDKSLYASYGILTSCEIQKEYKRITTKRVGDEKIIDEYALLSVPKN